MKDAGFDEVLAATREALQGRFHLPSAALRPVVSQLLREARAPQAPTTFVGDLTERQVEVLRCLVSGMTRADVAGRLYLSVNTVRTHVQNMLDQRGLHSTQALVAEARRAGVVGIDEVDGVGRTHGTPHR
jgi:DNA-binding NarL/FixJ family response regulator